MVEGSLQLFGMESGSGEILYASNTYTAKLGGLSYPKKAFIPLDLRVPANSRIRRAYLEIAAVVPSIQHTKWRIWISGKPVTREFKPQVSVDSEEGYYTKSVYDVTPFLINMEEHSRHVVSVYYEGSQPIVVDHVGLLLLLDTTDSMHSYTYLSGALLLPPASEKSIPIELVSPPSNGDSTVRLIIKSPSKYAEARISLNGDEIARVTGVVGVEDLELRVPRLREKNVLTISHVQGGMSYFPKNLVVSTILCSTVFSHKPLLEIRKIEHVVSGEEVEIRTLIANRGDAETEKTLLVVMEHGSPLGRVELEPVKPGETREASMKIRVKKGYHVLTLRCIWSRRGKTEFVEEKIRIEC